jgi:hypothetical protein
MIAGNHRVALASDSSVVDRERTYPVEERR